MATRKSPQNKRMRLTKTRVDDRRINEVAVKAAEVVLPWEDVSPLYFSQWLEKFSKAQGATKELMFMSILPAVSSLLGLTSPAEQWCWLLMNEEMEDTLRHIHSERECGTLCRLFDGDSLYINTGSGNSRQEIERSSLSIGGFMQVRQFFSEIYPMMVASQSGFDLRFLIAVLCPRALTRKETQPFAAELGQTNLFNLSELYKAIYDDHKHGDIVYTLNNEALELYDQFDEQICQKHNNQWQNGQFLHMTTAASEGGKERRLVLRLAVTLFVVYSYIRRQLFQSYGPVPRVIPKPYMKYAINLMAYFQQQRKEIDKIMFDEEVESHDSLTDKIISFPGPVCTVSNLRACASSKVRAEWTPAVVKGTMADLDRSGIGESVTLERTIAFVKNPPDLITESALTQNTSLSKEQYEECFLCQDMNLSTNKREGLIAKARLSREIQAYLSQNKEN
ncbi:hypothetical protein OS493_010579 [Desmophyllum pertusum]|uniref:Uncharacterized protein n=1 Tax=Desmophyllum pertusum TaxID=174260 RepID=A0A9X0D4G4_9CNID|nr:hypothetical protein OS493_010579 [Desmophyllum pertusum]